MDGAFCFVGGAGNLVCSGGLVDWWMVVAIVGRSRICNAGKSGRVK